MRDTDTSDEAFLEWRRSTGQMSESVGSWREAVRRCEAQMINQLRELLSNREKEVSALKAQMEERERKAFEAGLYDSWYSDKVMTKTEIEKAWLAYKERK